MPGRQWPLSGRSYVGWVYLPLGLILAAPRRGALDLALGSRELSRSGGPLVSTWLQPFLTLGWWPLEPQVGGKVKCLCSLPGDLGAGAGCEDPGRQAPFPEDLAVGQWEAAGHPGPGFPWPCCLSVPG